MLSNAFFPKFPVMAALGLVAAVPALAFAQSGSAGTRSGATIDGVGQTLTVDCEGRAAVVSGTENEISFVGDCPSLTVTGTDNRIRIALRAGAPVNVSGVDNVVTWSTAGKARPRVSIQGVGNRVAPAR